MNFTQEQLQNNPLFDPYNQSTIYAISQGSDTMGQLAEDDSRLLNKKALDEAFASVSDHD